MPKKDAEKWKYAKGSSCSGDQTSTQKLALAKPLKQSRKFGSLSSRLSVTEKTSSANVKISGGKTSLTSTGGGGAGWAPMCALDLFDSDSSTSDGKVVAHVPHRKHPRKSPLPKPIPKPSDAPVAKGTSAQSFTFHLS
jgi:hypothetical protein